MNTRYLLWLAALIFVFRILIFDIDRIVSKTQLTPLNFVKFTLGSGRTVIIPRVQFN
jgi:hypothetical protein